MEIMERTEAAKLGLTKFFTGRPCIKGHVTHRYTASGNCSKCASLRSAKYSKKLSAARKSVGIVEYNRIVPARLVEMLDAVIAAAKLAPPPCPNGCPPGAVCMACDTSGWG
jgi:hypothetical protein